MKKIVPQNFSTIGIAEHPRINIALPIDLLEYIPNTNPAFKVNSKVFYYPDVLNFSKKIGSTEYIVSSSFEDEGQKSILEQFKKIIMESEVSQI